MRRAPHEGQTPRRSHEYATSFSWPQPAQRSLRKPWAKDAATSFCSSLRSLRDDLGAGRRVETTPQREVEVDALRKLFGLHVQPGVAR
jgi:hypothetical protein